jgi:hypothetical protein
MTTYRRAALTIGIVCLAIAAVPSTVAAIEEPGWGSKDSVFDDSGNSDTALQKGYIHTTEDTVQFRANFSHSSTNGLDGGTFQVYIDSDADSETGFDKNTVNDGDWGSFYDEALGSIGADYRVLLSDGFTPMIQEYDGDAGFEKVKDISTAEDEDGIVAEINKETIGNPATYNVRFAHISSTADTSPKDSDYTGVPDKAVRISEDGDSSDATETATVNADVQFGDTGVDEDATVEFTITDDNGDVAGTRPVDFSGDGTTSDVTFSVVPTNFDDGKGEVAVEVVGDDQYLFEREVDNTAEITGISTGGDSDTVNLHLSTINATVKFPDSPTVDEGTTARFTLKDDNEDKSSRNVPITSNDDKEVYFTVNPNNFNGGSQSELSVEVTGDDDYPFKGSSDPSNINEGDSIDPTDFNAGDIGQEIRITGPGSNVDIDGGTGDQKFTVGVELDTTGGEAIYSFLHVIEFDSDRLDEDNIALTTKNNAKDGTNTLPGANSQDTNYSVTVNEREEEPGKYEISITSNGMSDPAVLDSGNTEELYQLEFKFQNNDDLAEEINQGESINLAPSTAEETRLTDTNGDVLSYTSSAENVDVTNGNTRITSTEVTHETEDGNMVNAPTKFEFDIQTNDGKLDNVKLSDSTTSGQLSESGDDDTKIDCGGESECSDTLTYTPSGGEATLAGDEYAPNRNFEVIVEDSSGETYTYDDQDLDALDPATIYEEADASEGGDDGEVTLGDVTTVIRNRGAGDGGLPWDDDDLARADVNNDGEIDITDVTSVTSEYSPSP